MENQMERKAENKIAQIIYEESLTPYLVMVNKIS